MGSAAKNIYSFEGFALDTQRRELRKGDVHVELRPKSFDVLACLVENAGRLVSKDDLMRAVWSDVVVTDDSLTRCISDVRAALDDSAQRVIKTVPRRGYMLAAPLMISETPGSGEPAATKDQPVASSTPSPSAAQPTASPANEAHSAPTARTMATRLPPVVVGALAVGLLLCVSALAFDWSRQSPARAIHPVVAVAPFAALDASQQTSQLSRAIAEDLTTTLGRFRALSVIAPNSAAQASAASNEVTAVAGALKARYIVQGSLRQNENRIRITARLVDSETTKQLWSASYDRPSDSLLAVDDEISQQIVRALFATIDKAELERIRQKPPTSRTAYDDTHQANLLMRNIQRDGRGATIAAARALYQKAIAADPAYAPAVNGLAFTYLAAWLEPTHGSPIATEHQNPKIIAQAEALARKAVDLDEGLAEARATLGWTLNWLNRPREALAAYERALQINPNLVDGRYAVLLSHHGRAEEAVTYTTRIMRLDPLYPPNYTYYLGKGHFFAGRLEESYPLIKAASAQMPTHRPSKVLLTAVTMLTNRPDETRDAVTQLLRIEPKFTITNWMTFMRVSHEPSAKKLVAALKWAGLAE